MANRFELPPPPWPEHSRAVDRLLEGVRARLAFVEQRQRPPFPHVLQRGQYGKISDAERREIAEIGYSLTAGEVGEIYGVSEFTVSKIRARAGLDGRRMGGIRRKRR